MESKRWKRYQNYRAVFSILNVDEIDRRWLEDLKMELKIVNMRLKSG